MTQSLWKRFWHFIWEEDSVASWIANVILAFIIIKFVVYPGLGWMLSTSHPIVAVVSGSMEHDSDLESWWHSQCIGITQEELYTDYGITMEQFRGFPFKAGFNKGDIMILKGTDNSQIGDVIVYSIQEQSDPIIHRIVSIKDENSHNVYKTKGDHNCGVNPFEERVEQSQVLGKAVVRVPWLGWVKLTFMQIVWWLMSIFS